MKKLGIILALLCVSICTFLLFYGDTALQKWQEYNFQSQVKKTIEAGDKLDLAKDSSVKSGWIGDNYVKVYYPNSNSVEATEIKKSLEEQTKGLVEDKLDFNKDIKEITFYGSKEKEAAFANVTELSLEKVSHKINNKEVEAASSKTLLSYYLGKDGKEFSLSNLFSSPDEAKQKFLSKIKQQLAVKGLSEEKNKEVITTLRDKDMATWKFTYDESKFNINIEPIVSDVSSVEVSINDVFKYIEEAYLKGEDLEKYKTYIKKRTRKAVALTFDDGPSPKTSL